MTIKTDLNKTAARSIELAQFSIQLNCKAYGRML